MVQLSIEKLHYEYLGDLRAGDNQNIRQGDLEQFLFAYQGFAEREDGDALMRRAVAELVKVAGNTSQNLREAVAETIENNVRKLIVDETPINPKYYEKMSQLLDALIDQRRQDAISYAEYLKQIVELTRKAKRGPNAGSYPKSVDCAAKRALFDNLDKDEALSIKVDGAVRSHMQDGWRHNVMKSRRVRRAIEDAMGEAMAEERKPMWIVADAARRATQHADASRMGFTARQPFTGAPVLPKLVRDIDGDGQVEILFETQKVEYDNYVHLGWELGRIVDGSLKSLDAWSHAIQVYDFADINRDGAVDLLFAEGFDAGRALLKAKFGDGSGRFGSAQTVLSLSVENGFPTYGFLARFNVVDADARANPGYRATRCQNATVARQSAGLALWAMAVLVSAGNV